MNKKRNIRPFQKQKKLTRIPHVTNISSIDLNQLIQQNQAFQKVIQEKEEDVYRLEVLGEIKQSVLTDQSPQEFARKTFDFLSNLISYDHANVILFNFNKNTAKVLATGGTESLDILPGDIYPLEDCFANFNDLDKGHIQHNQAVLSPQPFCLLDKKLGTTGIQAHISLLLVSHNEVIGSLNIASFQPAGFNKKDIRIARDVADSLAVAIQKAMLFEETRVKAAELEALAELSSTLRKAEKWKEIIYVMIRTSMQLTKAPIAGFFWSDHQKIRMISKDSRESPEYFKDQEWLADQKTMDLINLQSPIFEAGSLSENSPYLPLPFPVQSIAILPVKTLGVVAGKLFLAFETKQEFTKEDRRLFTSMADISGSALHRARILGTLEQRVADRTRDLSTLYNIANIISRSLDLQSTLDQCLHSIIEVLGAEIGFIHFIEDDNHTLVRQVQAGWPQEASADENRFFKDLFDRQHPVIIADLNAAQMLSPESSLLSMYLAFISAPIFGRQGALGLISFFSKKPNAFTHDELSLLTSIANHISIAVENNRLHQKADEAIIIEERQRLARELHDSISQLLYSQLLFSGASLKLIDNSDPELLKSYLFRLSDVADQAFKEMRLMIYSLRPQVLESVGLIGALQQRLNTVEQRAGMQTNLLVEGVDNLPTLIEDGLFRITQEALNNALKHASASSIIVRLEKSDQAILLEVSDNGVGFDRNNVIEGIGLSSMEERAKQIGGNLQIETSPGKGTVIRAIIDHKTIER